MFGFLRGLVLGVVLIAAGWLGGSIYPAPSAVTAPIAQRVPNLAARLGIDDVSLDRLQAFLTEEQVIALRHDVSAAASAAGEVILVEAVDGDVELQSDVIEEEALPASGNFESELRLCPGMTVANGPPVDAERRVRNFTNVVDVNGVMVAAAPARGACLSSAFGIRNGRRHKGIDLHAADGGPILAAADGVVVERKFRDDYGNMLLIDHGSGVFTRYAHLSSFAQGVVVGARVSAGQQVGLMGNTASYRIPVHLHYEVLVGDYNTPAGSFGLEPRSPLG